jgi:hypothetical protein
MNVLATFLGMSNIDEGIVDANDLCCAYIHGWVNGSWEQRHDCEENIRTKSKQIAIDICRHLMREGYELRDDILNGTRQDTRNFRVYLE